MNRITLFLMAATMGLTGGRASGANQPDKPDRVVEAVLQLEARGTVTHRADDLGGAVEASDRARWAAGYVHTADGWQRFDAATQIDNRLREYHQRRSTEPLTPEQHLELANWCRDQKLKDQERAHLWNTGALMASAGIYERMGLRLGPDGWLTPEERSRMREQEAALNSNLKHWMRQATALQHRFGSSDKNAWTAAHNDLMAISDIRALPALQTTVASTNSHAAVSFTRWAGKRSQAIASLALVRMSIDSPWKNARETAAEELSGRRRDHSVPPLLHALSKPIELKLSDSNLPRGQFANDLLAISVRESWQSIERRSYVIQYEPQRVLGYRPRTGQVYFGTDTRPIVRPDDVAPQIDQFHKAQIDQLQKDNQTIANYNQRISHVLSQITGSSAKSSPEEWWNLWADFTATDVPQDKTLVEVSETESVRPPDRFVLIPSCLPGSTPILTANGCQSIESIRIGDIVLAKDVETGELTYKPVIRTTVRSPQPLTTLHTKGDSIRATLGHYFWVSGLGWRMAKEIKPGQRLHGVQGTVTVTDISPGGREAVYNLVVEGTNSYFVGESHVLSHDVTSPVPTDIVVPGLAAR